MSKYNDRYINLKDQDLVLKWRRLEDNTYNFTLYYWESYGNYFELVKSELFNEFKFKDELINYCSGKYAFKNVPEKLFNKFKNFLYGKQKHDETLPDNYNTLKKFLDKQVIILRQGLKPNFEGTLIEVKHSDIFDLPAATVVDKDGKKMLVFNPNHIILKRNGKY